MSKDSYEKLGVNVLPELRNALEALAAVRNHKNTSQTVRDILASAVEEAIKNKEIKRTLVEDKDGMEEQDNDSQHPQYRGDPVGLLQITDRMLIDQCLWEYANNHEPITTDNTTQAAEIIVERYTQLSCTGPTGTKVCPHCKKSVRYTQYGENAVLLYQHGQVKGGCPIGRSPVIADRLFSYPADINSVTEMRRIIESD